LKLNRYRKVSEKYHTVMLVNKLKSILELVNPTYIFEYEENAMMNIKADEYARSDKFVYIEEFTQGRYVIEGYKKKKITRVQIWFCIFCEMHSDAIKREQLRNQIEIEIVFPFMERLPKIETWQFFTPLPRFDANEISIMLQFEYKNDIC